MEIIEENFMNNYFNKTNTNFSKIKNFKKNIINNNNYHFFPLIVSERGSKKILGKTSSAIAYKKRHNSIENFKINKRSIYYFKQMINKNDKKRKNEIFFTESSDNIYNSRKTSKFTNEKSELLKNNGDIIINQNKYRDKIIELNNNNIDRAIKEIFMKK